jgi:hypothetical protein
MARGRKTGGRKKGTRNKATAQRQAEVAASGSTPLETMLTKMRFHLKAAEDEMAKSERNAAEVIKALDKAAEAAHDAAPYVHPRLAAVQHTGANEGPIEHTLDVGAQDELIQRIAEIATRLHGTGEAGGSR